MASLATDAFTRADGGLGANYTTIGSALAISGNHVVPGTPASDCGAAYTAITWPDDQYGQVAISGTDTTGDQTGIGVMLRCTDVSNFYRVIVCGEATNNVTVAKVVGGSYSVIAQITQAWTAGDILYAEVQGTTIKVYRNGVQIGTNYTDSGLASGDVGIFYSSSADNITADDFEGGDFSAGGTDATVDLDTADAVAAVAASVVAPPKPRPTPPFSEVNLRM